MSGIEFLTITSTEGDVDAVINLAKVTGLSSVTANFVTTNNDDQIEIDGLAAGVPVVVKATATLDNLDVGLASSSGAADALTVSVKTNTTSLNLDAAGIETLNLVAGGAAGTVDLAGVSPSAGSATTVNLTGADATKDFILKSLHTGINNINAAGLAGSLTLASGDRDSDALTITAGGNNDQLAMENTADVLVAGANEALTATASAAAGNADTLTIVYTGIVGGVSVDLSAADQVVTMDGTASTSVQSGFENIDLKGYVGFAGVVTGSDSANRITGTALADRINAGKGNDTIVIDAGTRANDDQMNGGAGADTLSIAAGLTATIDGDTDLVSIETISMVGAGTLIFTGQTEALSYKTAAGVATVTAGEGASTFTLLGDNDIIKLNTYTATASTVLGHTISGFNPATGKDTVFLSEAGIEAILGGSNDLIKAGKSDVDVTAIASVITATGSGVYDLAGQAATTIVQIATNAANDAAAKALIIDGGTHALKANVAMAAGDIILVLYDDGTDSYLAAVETGAVIANDGLFAAANTTVTTLITFTGVADSSGFHLDAFDFAA